MINYQTLLIDVKVVTQFKFLSLNIFKSSTKICLTFQQLKNRILFILTFDRKNKKRLQIQVNTKVSNSSQFQYRSF